VSSSKKVIFCTYSSIYSSKVLEQLIADTDFEVVGIINSTRVLNSSYHPFRGAITQLKISGFRYSSYLFFITDFFKWAQPLFSIKKWPLRNVHALAKKNKIPIIDTKNINKAEVIEFIKNSNANLLLCAHFNQLIKNEILSINNLQCINIHPSLLPNYKGVDPVFFAMRDEAEEIGVTLHKMDESFDSGDILLQTAMKLDRTKSLLFNNCMLFDEGAKLAIKWIKSNDHTTQTISQKSHSADQYDSWPKRTDIKQFKKSGMRLMRLSGLWNQQ